MRDVLRYLADCRYIWMWGLLAALPMRPCSDCTASAGRRSGIRCCWAAAFGLFSWLSDSFVTERITVA